MKLYKKLTAVLMLFISSAVLFSCGEEEAALKSDAVRINTVSVKKTSVSYSSEYPGTVEGESRVNLSTKLMGEVTYLPFDSGDRIKKGETLVKINSGDLDAKLQQVNANIIQAEAAFTNVEINYNRVKNLFEKESATPKEMEDIRMAYDVARAQLKAAEEMKKEIENILKYSDIRSPFDGYIVNKFLNEGDVAAPGHPILIVENSNNFKINASVPASKIYQFVVGQKVDIKIDASQEGLYEGIVTEVNPGGNSYSKQFQVTVSMKDVNVNNSTVRSGMYASISLAGEMKSVVTVDENLLVKRGQLVGVYSVTENNESILRWVRLGKKINGKYEVLSGLKEGDIIIVDKDKIKEGQKVEVI